MSARGPDGPQAVAGWYARFRHPVAIFGNGVGDHLTTLPGLRALASLFPSRLSLVCLPDARREFFADVPLRSVCEIEMPKRRGKRHFAARRAAEGVRRCDALFSFNPWHSSSVDRLLELLSPEFTVGFSETFDVCLDKISEQHEVDRNFGLAATLEPGLRLERFISPPVLPERIRRHVRQYLRQTVPGRKILAVHNEASVAERNWPKRRLDALLAEFLRRHPEFVIFQFGVRSKLFADMPGRGRPLYSGFLPLQYSFAVVAQSRLFLGVDSCMLHAADFFRVPGVGMFGPTNPRRAGFKFARHHHLVAKGRMPCVRVTQVLNALESLLD